MTEPIENQERLIRQFGTPPPLLGRRDAVGEDLRFLRQRYTDDELRVALGRSTLKELVAELRADD